MKEYKQVIVVRSDLKLDKGKLAAQCCHASILSYNMAHEIDQKNWLNLLKH